MKEPPDMALLFPMLGAGMFAGEETSETMLDDDAIFAQVTASLSSSSRTAGTAYHTNGTN
jgi:hypothetical protein